MKKQTVIVLDDIDGTPGANTVPFSFKGINYEIDLSAEHEAQMAEALQSWIAAARRVARPRAKASTAAGKGVAAEARAYLRSKGYELPERGRIPRELLEEFYAAYPEKRN